MGKFRTRLALLFIVLIGCSVLAAGVFVAFMLERSHLNALQDSMKREIQIILATTEGSVQQYERRNGVFFSEQAIALKRSANARVTYIAADGTVLGDSDLNPSEMDNHMSREEIREAAAAGIGYSKRHSDSTGSNMLYVAMAVQDGRANVVGYLRLSMGLEEIETTIRHLWWGLIGGLLVVFVIAGLISYRAAYQLTRPIEKITRVARQITNMNYKSRVYLRNRDEIGQLGQAINTMADSLQLQMHRILENESRLSGVLDNMVSGVVMIDGDGKIVLVNRSAEDILGYTSDDLIGKRFDGAKQPYELIQLIKECVERGEHIRDEIMFYFPEERILEVNLVPMQAVEEEWLGLVIVLHDITAIRRLEKVRSEFVANVSHELKTPVAAVKGFAETLLNGAMNDAETARSFLQIIYDESERLNRLIGDILELSKIESKRVPLQFSPVHLGSFVAKTLDMMRTSADKKQISLDMKVDDDLYMEADEDRLRQILINLLSNGINYTPDGGKVKIEVEEVAPAGGEGDAETIRIVISDTGIGIPKKDLPRIFERFYRVDKARSRSSGGTGLGLSIVKHLVELHQGTIRVESELGLGSRFILELPVIQSWTK
ncbi:two-component system histidine kinase PnpS [Paenibacillus flagellatus]|uniref:histidine kinase n=1 Tax=Paenibacillus flagellatus TaxID=2211139 RepID=A0A2V5KX80_9BACL|nr:ATP-binding protein [Paenibacillus flagellatus]PYI56957.1 PAS domain-containing sensor histidine kinase [Paenibacillus flagellatus]